MAAGTWIYERGAVTTEGGPTTPVVPDDVQSITVEGSMNTTSGRFTLKVSIEPPDPLGSFAGGHLYLEIPDQSTGTDYVVGDTPVGSGAVTGAWTTIDLGMHTYDDAEPEPWLVHGQAPPDIDIELAVSCRLYVASFSPSIDKPLTRAGTSGETPSQTFTLMPQEPGVPTSGTSITDTSGPIAAQVLPADNSTGKLKTPVLVMVSSVPNNIPGWCYRIVTTWDDADPTDSTNQFVMTGTQTDPGPVYAGEDGISIPHTFVVDTPTENHSVIVWLQSGLTDDAGLIQWNDIVPGITPSFPITIGSTDGVTDATTFMAATIAATMAVVNNLFGVAPNGITNPYLGSGAVKTINVENLAITNPLLADLVVTAGKLADGAATTTKLADGGTTTVKIADLNVDSNKLAASAVVNSKLALLAVAAGNLIDLAVATGKLSDDAVTAAKLAALAVDAAAIQDNAVGSTALAALAVTGAKIANAAVGSAAIADLAVGTAAIAALAVDSGKLGNLAVTNGKVANLAVGNAAIQLLAVDTGILANLAVSNGKVQDLAVTGAKIGYATIANANLGSLIVANGNIADLAVSNAKIQDLSVTGAKIQDATITSAKITSLGVDKLTAGTAIIGNGQMIVKYAGAGTLRNSYIGAGIIGCQNDSQVQTIRIEGYTYNDARGAGGYITVNDGQGYANVTIDGGGGIACSTLTMGAWGASGTGQINANGFINFANGTTNTANSGPQFNANLPTYPQGFIKIKVNGSEMRVPYYNT